MMRDRFFQKTSLLVLLISVLLAGCGSSPPPTEFYTLNSLGSMTQQTQPSEADQNIAIGIGPVQIPQILDRPQIVTRTGPNKLKVDEFHRWAGPLKAGFAQVLAENIALLLTTDRVAVYPWEGDFKPHYRIALDIRYFEGQLGKNVVLDVVWRVAGQEGQKIQATKASVINEPLAAADYESLVAAKSQAIAQLSREIAQEIRKLQSGGKSQ
ncbi:MAG: PqiC family protein [Desulfobacterales bacterium]|jgi:uncharacterized lipoprotein YmbA|nr:PqiC family protein [Desulfobacterales bacterium]MDH3829571.1 PqiC family protein [Desulfobacterales bacterium]MDH3886562.1 PqiC family protein [Desulfobacterales bacterium]